MDNSHRRILLIDDSPVAIKALKTVLGLHQGWEIVGEASNGTQGLKLFQQKEPDVVIVDFQMPGMNGLDVGRQIRRLAPGVLLILFTLHAGAQLDAMARDAGFDAVLSKSAPFPIVAIIETMKGFPPDTRATDNAVPAEDTLPMEQ